ncbi:MAG: multicopper oxidase family protein [Gaiellaceae bacterium]
MFRPLRIALVAAGAVAILAALGWIGHAWWESRLPGMYNVMAHGTLDRGGGPVGAHTAHEQGGQSVDSLREPATGRPDVRFTLTARHASVQLASGRTADVLTYDGRVPGPELRARQGDLVEVTLVNEDVDRGVTIHWHGVDVPNAEDGVAGVTQDAVRPGESYTYRFRAKQVGTFWYHTHQFSSKDVRRGLFGAFVIEPRGNQRSVYDRVVMVHSVGGRQAVNLADGVERRVVAPGTPVRLRIVNAENTPRQLAVGGAPFRLVAVDGTDLHEPGELSRTILELAAGGRYDLVLTMPDNPVELSVLHTDARLVLSRDGQAAGTTAPAQGRELDLLTYGTPTGTPFDAGSRFDRTFRLDVGRKFGFVDGRPGRQWTINGKVFPAMPVFFVRRGDLVKVTITNDSGAVHPMHLHGHHMLVLSRNGVPSSGSPWWSDTLNVKDGERYEVAFRADNPGLWMNHCHNLAHAAQGLTMHVAYEGASTPFTVGGRAGNRPE